MSPPAGGHKGRPYIFGVLFPMGCLVALICRGGACPRPRAIRQDKSPAFGCVPDAGDLSVPGGDETNMANYTEYYLSLIHI